MYDIPKNIMVNGQSYTIRREGDYRLVLDCLFCLTDLELTKEERILACLIIFYQNFDNFEDLIKERNLEELTLKMFDFFNCGESNNGSRSNGRNLVDWEKDSQLICSAVNKVAGKEIRELPYLHWWTFMGYYMNMGECLYSNILQIRDKIVRGKKLEKNEMEFRRRNPQYFIWNSKTIEQQEADSLIKDLWNNGK